MRRLQEKFNNICQCGHVKRQHEGDDYSEYCFAWIYLTGPCGCKEFKVDNLRYLEKVANEHTSL